MNGGEGEGGVRRNLLLLVNHHTWFTNQRIRFLTRTLFRNDTLYFIW